MCNIYYICLWLVYLGVAIGSASAKSMTENPENWSTSAPTVVTSETSNISPTVSHNNQTSSNVTGDLSSEDGNVSSNTPLPENTSEKMVDSDKTSTHISATSPTTSASSTDSSTSTKSKKVGVEVNETDGAGVTEKPIISTKLPTANEVVSMTSTILSKSGAPSSANETLPDETVTTNMTTMSTEVVSKTTVVKLEPTTTTGSNSVSVHTTSTDVSSNKQSTLSRTSMHEKSPGNSPKGTSASNINQTAPSKLKATTVALVSSTTPMNNQEMESIDVSEPSEGRFMTGFIVVVAVVIIFYLFYHNRRKIIITIQQCRSKQHLRDRPRSKDYQLLSDNGDVTLTGIDRDVTTKNYIY